MPEPALVCLPTKKPNVLAGSSTDGVPKIVATGSAAAKASE